jgi:hypothetical protein
MVLRLKQNNRFDQAAKTSTGERRPRMQRQNPSAPGESVEKKISLTGDAGAKMLHIETQGVP